MVVIFSLYCIVSQDIEDEDPIERMKMEKEFEITCLEHEERDTCLVN